MSVFFVVYFIQLVNFILFLQMDKNEVNRKINAGDFVKKPSFGKSDVWKNYFRVFNASDESQMNWVICHHCKDAFFHDPHKTGTSKLKQHVEKCVKSASNSKITSFYNTTTAPNFSASEKAAVVDSLVSLCSKDVRPFQIVSGEGFQEFCEAIYTLGYKHGSANDGCSSIGDLLPHRTTISRAANELKIKNKEAFSQFLQSVKLRHFSLTLDFWSNDVSKDHYITVTIHFIHESNLHWICLCTRLFNEPKTSAAILLFLQSLLAEYDINTSECSIVYVTDNASNLIKTLQNDLHLRCACHCINLAVVKAFDVDAVQRLIQCSKKIVQHFKHANLQSQLRQSLKQDVPTRWNSIFIMLSSIYEQFNDVASILLSRNEQSLLTDFNNELASNLLPFLSDIKDCSEELSADKYPTLPSVVPWYYKLLSNCENSNEEDCMGIFKSKFKEELKNKLHISSFHYIATFLHPMFKHLNFLPKADKKATIADVRKVLVTLGFKNDEDIECEAPAHKVRRNSILQMFSESKEQDEVQQYMDKPVRNCSTEGLLEWWKKEEEDFPSLFKLSNFILCIPASEATSERVFSETGRTLANRRQNLDPNSLENLVFNHHYLNFSKIFKQ